MALKAGLSTAAWLLLLVCGVGATLYLGAEMAHHPGEETGHETGEPDLLPVPAAEIRAVEIVVRGELRRIERDPTGVWLHHRHKDGEVGPHAHVAEAGAAESIRQRVEMLSRMRIERTIGTADAASGRYGVALPPVIVLVYAAPSAPVLRLQVGDATPDGHSRYVLVPERGTIITVPDYHVQNLLRLFEEAGDA